jgi:P-type Ca2+ transporter type 2C
MTNIKYTGLSTKEAKENLKTFGLNEIIDVNKVTWVDVLLRQVKNNFLIYLLLAATILSFIVGKSVTAYTIIVVIGLVIGVGFFQEYKAEKAVSALKKMITPTSLVIRDSKEQEILSSEIVPGDILILRTGEKIPADGKILFQKNLLVNESILTGESKEIKKITVNNKKVTDENFLFMGSFIITGKCIVEVLHTGMNTKFGKIAKMISGAEKELPLQKKINKITKVLSVFGLSLAIITGLLVLFKSPVITNAIIVDVIILVIAIAVASFPEGLPVVLITTLSAGAYRMAKHNAIVNRMSIIETLGETTVICSDKTGTITKGEMTVKKICFANNVLDVSGIGFENKGDILKDGSVVDVSKNKDLNLLIKTCVLCNDSYIKEVTNESNINVSGSPTEAALLVLASKVNIFKDDFDVVKEEEVPFSSESKIMTVLVKEKNAKTIYVKGALEIILDKCNRILKNGKVTKMTLNEKNAVLKNNLKITDNALRTLAFAYKDSDFKEMNKDLIFIGFVGMEDPPREGVKKTVALCKKAGIKIIMITGDNKNTALAISKEIGLPEGKVYEGHQIDAITDDELSRIINDVVVFARVKPEHKLRIVKALKVNKEIVTMTGDGVNDAPALKEAHVGVAMGIAGTDVSRSVADLTLKDDNFATLVNAIKEGRSIFRNIRKFMSYQISCNFSELFVILIGVLVASRLDWPIPILLPLQILFINIITDDFSAIALSFNPISEDIMHEKPRHREILTKNLSFLILFAGLLRTFFVLLVFYISFNVLNYGVIHATSTAFLTLIMLEIFGAFTFRSFRKRVFGRSLFVNKYLFYASIISLIITVIIMYTPLNKIFELSGLFIIEWMLAVVAGILFVSIFDILIYINNKKNFWKIDA